MSRRCISVSTRTKNHGNMVQGVVTTRSSSDDVAFPTSLFDPDPLDEGCPKARRDKVGHLIRIEGLQGIAGY